jgi:hypothetical protein
MSKEIYKYRPNNECTLKMLENSELYFPFPTEFNDPFDTNFTVDYSGNEEQWIRFLKRIDFPKNVFDIALKLIKENNYNFDFEKFAPQLQIKETLRKNWIVCCFSEVNDSILMWSHYANNHEGICIGFEKYICTPSNQCGILLEDSNNQELYLINDVPKNLHFLKNVEYVLSLPKSYNLFSDNPNRLLEFFYHKFEHWKYENETRVTMYYPHYNKHTFKFTKTILKSIIFGIKIDDNYKQKIISIVKRNYNNVKLYQARKSIKEFAIEFDEVIK